MALLEQAHGDRAWSSDGLLPREALSRWRDWACGALAPMQVHSPDEGRFSAHWKSHALGQLQLVSLKASALTVLHEGEARRAAGGATLQLLYSRKSTFFSRVGSRSFALAAGECVLLDNAQPYEMSMGEHEAIDVVMPASWLERWLPDPHALVARPFCAARRWGAPFGGLLHALADELGGSPVSRPALADQIGALLALALADAPPAATPHKARLARRLVRQIEERHAELELDPAAVAAEAGISRRYLHAVLAEAGESFLGVLTRTRLDRASSLLADRRFHRLPIADIAARCGFSDPSYFARVFRRRFGAGPQAWRASRMN